MGNIVVSNSGSVKDSVLGDIINHWAINDYDAGLGKVNSEIKQLLKKRACCTRQTDMKIALPTIDLTKDAPASFSNNYTNIKIKIFENDEELQNNCNINDVDYIDDNDYKLPDNFASGGASATRACQTLYEGDGQYIIGLCDSIKEDRANQSDDKTIIAYGQYQDDRLNVYEDCNCLNSLLRTQLNIHSSTDGALELSPDEIVQQFDKRCTFIHDAAYKIKDITSQQLCINQVITGNMTAEEKGVININQNNSGCAPEDTMDVSINKNSFENSPSVLSTPTSTITSTLPSTSTTTTVPSVSSVSSTNQANIQLIDNKNKLNIILTIVLIIVILIMFGIYKYFVH